MKGDSLFARAKTSVVFAVLILGTLALPQLFLLHRIIMVGCGIMAVLEIYYAYHSPSRIVGLGAEPYPFETVVVQSAIIIAGAIAYTQLNRSQAIVAQIGVITCDTMAYVTGKLLGRKIIRTRPFPEISPNKSFEGTIGGIICSMLALLVWFLYGPNTAKISTVIWAILFTGPLAVIGDVVGSLTKRVLDIKDSNACTYDHRILRYPEALAKGFGGYLDRFDSMFVVALVLTILYRSQ